MRLLMINLLATALVLFSASFASAYELRLVSATPANTISSVGDIVSYDIFLDTQGVNEGIVLFSASLIFDPAVVNYRLDLSDAEDYYPLYAPGSGKTQPATWLIPIADPHQLWPAPPAGLNQVNVDFIEVNLNESIGTSTNEYLGTLAFEVTGEGTSAMNWSFDGGGNIFNVQGVAIDEQVSMVNTLPVITTIPEPTTALLVGLGMVGLGVAGRRRA